MTDSSHAPDVEDKSSRYLVIASTGITRLIRVCRENGVNPDGCYMNKSVNGVAWPDYN